MDTITLPVEYERAIAKHDAKNLRAEIATGWGATTEGKAITQKYHARLVDGVKEALAKDWGRYDVRAFVARIRALEPEVIALSVLQTALHSVGMGNTIRTTLLDLGRSISRECWAAGLTEEHPNIAKRIRRAIKRRHGNANTRNIAARAAAKHAGYSERAWSNSAMLAAGEWLYNILMATLPDVFEKVPCDCGPESMLTIAPDAWKVADAMLHNVVINNPVFWPSKQAPKPWVDWNDGGSWDDRVNGHVTFLRTHHKDTHAAVKFAIKEGQMQPALDAVNGLQDVAFKINTRVLDVLKGCVVRGIEVEGLPMFLDLPKPQMDKPWGDMSEPEQKLWKIKASEVKAVNRAAIGDRVLFSEDMTIADEMSKLDRFYTPMNCDWRGRVYGLTHFNFQREDHIRALFLFADGAPIGEEGLWWLKVHVANCGDFDKASKKPLAERVQWCDDNIELITRTATQPLEDHAWLDADKPFLFVAACTELVEAITAGPAYVTHLPISFDGSCSGLQHLCAMTRAAEGALVNLTPSAKPQDVYNTIAELVAIGVAEDTADAARELARLFLAYGITRSLVKRNVMTYSYSSQKFGMASQQQTDTMDVLSREVLEGKLQEHPFDGYQYGRKEKPGPAARYIAGHVFDAIEERIEKPAEAMHFLQGLAKALAHEGKPVSWTTPVGIPWINRYHDPKTKRVELFLQDGGVKVRTRITLAEGHHSEIAKAKAASGIAPNFVHALDAAHLLRTVLAARAEGILQIATVHDSFGCLAPHAKRFNQIIREEFFRMYDEHDVLTEILEQASCDLTDANRHRLPPRPLNGPLELKGVLKADFAFS